MQRTKDLPAAHAAGRSPTEGLDLMSHLDQNGAEGSSTTGVSGQGPAARAPGAGLFGPLSSGVTRMVLLRLLMRLIGLVSTSILARILLPEDFGLVGIAFAVIGSLEAFTTFGSNLSIVRERNVTRDLYDTAWTIELARGALIAVLLAALAHPAARFFGDPRVTPIVYVLAAMSLIQSSENIGTIDFMKGLRFDREFRLFLSMKMIGFVVTIAAALLLRNYWALVIGSLASRVGRTALSYRMHPFRPRLSLSAWRAIFTFSSWVWIYSVIGFANSLGQTALAAKLINPRELGFFRVGLEVGALPASEFQGPALRVLFPALSQISGETQRFVQLFADAFQTMFLGQAALTIGLALVAEPFVRVVYGDAWSNMAPFVSLVAIAMFFQLPSGIAEQMFLAAGRQRLFAIIALGSTAVRLPLLVVGLHGWGLIGAGWALCAAALFEAALTILLATRVLGLSLAALFRGSWRCVAAVGAMTFAVSELASIWPPPGGFLDNVVLLGVLVFVGAVAFISCDAGLWLAAGKPDGAESQFCRFFGNRIAALKFQRILGWR
jgi:lipopolysaccharide exporter